MARVRNIPFAERENELGGAWFNAEFAGKAGHKGAAFQLLPEHRGFNVAPAIRDLAKAYFAEHRISWHRYANHARSSQVLCLNVLMPLARRPDLLARIVERAVGISGPEMLDVEPGPDGHPWFVGFEWIGRRDYLNEAGKNGQRTRGSNCTSADAILRFRHQGRIEAVLIEWKYGESYNGPIDESGNEERLRRYRDIVFAPNGPIRENLDIKVEDFFWEPFYQLVRQQMLAFQMQKLREDGADRVRVLHIAPAANVALRKVTAPALKNRGDDAFAVFRSLLVVKENFVSCTTEGLFGPMLEDNGADEWASYLRGRYRFMTEGG
jgi:hypothetical protein